MTDETEQAEVAKAKGASSLAGVITDLGLTAAFTAAFAWAGGVALDQGFGVSIPFVAGWLLPLTGLYLAQLVTGQLATAWHGARVKADVNLIAATLAAQEAIQQQQSMSGLTDLLDSLSKPSGNSGAYL